MACSPNPGILRFAGLVTLAIAFTPVFGQTRLSLDEVNRRTPPDYLALHAGEQVVVRGVVTAPAYHFAEYTCLGIQDGRSGLVLRVPGSGGVLNGLHPGDDVEAQGTVYTYAGLPTVSVASATVLGRKAVPIPEDVTVEQVSDLRYVGRLVHLRGRFRNFNDTYTGSQVYLENKFMLFMPRSSGPLDPILVGFSPGDELEATGVLLQYCTSKPYDKGFELATDANHVVHYERAFTVPPFLLASGLSVVLFVAFVLWSRERRLRNQREKLRKTYQLGEDILGAPSAAAILQRVTGALPGVLEVTSAHLYVYNRSAKTLDAVVGESGEPVSISLSTPPAGTQAGAVACFHYRTLLVIPDIDRSPFPMAPTEGHSPRSLLFVPMMAQGEVVGVLELDQDNRVRDFTADEQALAQHLGNQIGVAIRLLDQRSVQEQLFRTEKLAAVGRLISGVVNELQTPLASISDLANRALEKGHAGAAEREVGAIAAEAQKAAAMVARLVSFASAEQVEARPVCITTLLKNLIDFRESDLKASGIRVRDMASREPLYVLGSEGQLEQVFLNLLVHAEQSLAQAPQKVVTLRTSVLAKRLLVEISFSSPVEVRKPEETAAVLGVTRSVIAGHGGEVRLIEKANTEPRFEVELPVLAKERATPAIAANAPTNQEYSRRMTALVIEPDDAAQRQILGLLSARGFRVVPINNADNALELAHRMRFDAAFCSVHAPGLNWVELSERMHSRVAGFVLLSDSYDAELAADFEGDGRFVLPKPVQDAELERVLRAIDRGLSAKVIPFKNGVA